MGKTLGAVVLAACVLAVTAGQAVAMNPTSSCGLLGTSVLSNEARTSNAFQDVRAVVVNADAGDVDVAGGLRSLTTVDTHACWNSTSSSTVTEQLRDGVLTITARCGQQGPISLGLGPCYRDIAVAAPASVAVTVVSAAGDVRTTDVGGAVDLRTAAGDVTGRNLGGDRLSGETSAGDVLIDSLHAPGSVAARSSAGNVEVRVPVGAYAIDAGTSAGDVTLQGLTPDAGSARHILARTSSGDVLVRAR